MGQYRKGESFTAQGDDGRIHLVTTWIEFVDEADGRAASPRWEPSGFECLRIEDGRPVRALPGGGYEVASSGIVLQRIPLAADHGAPPGSAAENESASGDGPPADAMRPGSGLPRGTAESARLMSEFGITRSARFFQYHGYRYSKLADALDYARVMQTRPLSQEDDYADLAQRGADPAQPSAADDERLMLSWRISFADGQYAFADYRYDLLADAVAYARLERSGPMA